MLPKRLVLTMNLLRRIWKKKQGQALVEMALILPILLMLMFGCIEFGRIFGAYLLVNNLARDGVRYGVVGHTDSEIADVVLNNRLWLDPAHLTINISPSYESRNKGEALEVIVDYRVDLVAPFIAQVLPNPVPVSGMCVMRVE